MNPINPNQPSFQPPENLGSSLSDDDRNLIKEAHQYLDEFTASMQKLMVDLYDDGPDLKSDIQNFKQILGNLIDFLKQHGQRLEQLGEPNYNADSSGQNPFGTYANLLDSLNKHSLNLYLSNISNSQESESLLADVYGRLEVFVKYLPNAGA